MQSPITPSKILFFLCISFVLGIFLESLIKIPQFFIAGILILGVIFVFVMALFFARAKNSAILLVLGFCILSLILGVLRMQVSEFNTANDKLSKLNGTGKVVLTGTISGEPDVRDTFQKIKLEVADSTVLITTAKYPEYKYLDKIKVTGKLETPTETEDFSYKNYLMKDGIYSVMNFPKVSAQGGPRSAGEVTIMQRAYAGILFCKQKIRESIQNNFLPPQSSILEGTILGDNGAMTADLKSKLNITGLRHIIAVSGTHVVILGSILTSLLLACGFSRGKAFYIVIFFICIYILLTGLPPSGVRAGIMGGIFLLSQKFGRQAMGSRLITIACAVMLLINPLLLFYDVGFQLSFLAVLGLIYLEPYIKILIEKFTKDKAKNFVSIVSTTFAAQIFTLPIMVYNFGNISFVSPITNLLILPIVYGLMVFGFLASIAGVFSSILGWVLSVPCWFLLTYFVKVIDIFSQPWMGKIIANVSWIWLLLSYIVVGFLTRFLRQKFKKDFI